jgi:hypothetical protein
MSWSKYIVFDTRESTPADEKLHYFGSSIGDQEAWRIARGNAQDWIRMKCLSEDVPAAYFAVYELHSLPKVEMRPVVTFDMQQ